MPLLENDFFFIDSNAEVAQHFRSLFAVETATEWGKLVTCMSDICRYGVLQYQQLILSVEGFYYYGTYKYKKLLI